MPENPIIPISKEGLELFKKSLSTTAPNTSQFEGTFGEHVLDSQFDTGLKPGMNREDYLGEVQPISDKLANAVPRLLSKVGTEIVKTPGYLYALGEAGLTDKTLAESLDNAWINAAQHFDDATKEQFAIYKPKAVREGNLWDNFTSASFWTDEGVDGIGFLLSMMAPGAVLKATGLATKLAKVPGLAKIGTANIELGQATLLNTALESAAETKGIVDNLKQEFDEKIGKEINPNTGKLWTAEEAKQAIGDAAVNTFAMNMGLLIVPNTIMNKNLLGRFKTSNKILDELRDPITGKFVANNPLAKKSLIKEYAKHVGEATASEGFLEEAGQTTIENYNSKVALNKTNAGILEGLASEYINTLTTTEGQKSILLGAVLGALGGAVGKSRELKQEAQERSVLTKLIKDNFEGFSTEMNNLFVKDPSGKVELDPKTNTPKINMEEATKVISNLVKEQQSTNLQDLAAINGEKDLYDYIYNQQLARFALPYLKQEGGLEILNQHIEDTSKILSEKAKQFSKETDFSENEFKNNTKKTLQELQRNYDSIYSTVSELGLERLSDNPKHVELFANKIANVAYAETAKQMFLVDKIKELNQELTHLNISSTTDLPQTKIEKTKLEGRIKELSNNLNKSIKEYESIFDSKEQEKAFLNFSNKVTELEKEIDAATKKDEKKVKAEEKKAEKAATTGVVEKTKEEKEAEDLKKSTAEKDFYMSEALAATSLKEFNAFKPALDKHVLVSAEEKAKLTEHENKLKQAEGVDTTEDNTTQEDVSTFLNDNTVTSKVTADEQVTVSYKEIQQGKFRDLVKGISKVANVVMMRLFKHHFEDGMFKFTRDKNGLPDVDNNSGLDIDALNTIKVGDTVEFKLVELNDKAKDLFDRSQKDSIEKIEEHIKDGNLYGYSSKDNYGFDNKHIGIFNSDGKLIGFFQQPHAISGEVDGDVLDSYIISRTSIIRQRAFIISQLSKGEQVTSEVTDKGIGNLYTKLTPEGKIDPINKVLDTARDKDKLDNNLIFVVNNGEKLELPILENANHTAEVEAAIAELGAWGKKGSVYQLVKDTNDNWVPIPVYAELINESVINSIMDRLSALPEDIDPIVVVRALNPFIYTSTHKKVSLQVTRELGITNLTINGKTFTLSSVINTRKQEFIKELKTKRQNIEIKNINSSETQTLLKERGALITNATTYNGEYFVQPYIAFEDVTKGKVEKADKETTNIESKKADINRRRQGLNGIEEIVFSNPNFRLEGFEIDGNYWNVVTSTDRAKVLVNINGVIVPFYLTTGQAGKGLVPGWYPFFGIGKDGWLNKTDKSDMETYYERYWGKETSDIVKSISEELNGFYGTDPSNFKNDGDPNATSRPLSTLADKVEDYINSKLNYTPATNNADARKTLRSNVEQLGKEINAKYDAELAALENNTPLQGSIEDILNSRGINPEDLTKDDAFSRTEFFDPDSINTVDKVKITNWLKENLPGLSLFNAREVKELKTNIKDAVGMYRDMVIYLFNHSSNKTAYHEAFHGVFRNMLSPNERLVLIDEFAKTQMFKPTKANLEYIQEGYKKKFTDEQLTYLYYEELLADAFADYSDTFEPKKLSQRIIDFFDKILRFFGWYISPVTSSKLDELFYKINTGKYAKASLKAKQKVVDRPLSHFKDDNYVYKRIPGLGATFKATRIKSIGDSFIAEYWKKVNTGTNPKEIKPSEIYNDIFNKYTELIQKAATDKSISNDLIIDAAKVINNSAAIIAEANRYIGTFGIKVKADNLEYEEQNVSSDEQDPDVSTSDSKTTKNYGQDMVSIPGLKSASTRLKMFLSGIPVLDKGITKKDGFDFPVFHDFLGLYYFLERNLTDLNTFDEMIEELDSLSKIRPEVAIIKTKLLDGDGTMTKEQLRLLQNDFKANFSKQQLVYTLVKFDTDSVTGAVTFKVMDANRQTIKREIYDAWVSNLINPSRNTIAKHNPDGSVQPYGTDAAKALLNRWKTSIKKDMSYEDFNDILLEIGIEFSPEVLKKLLNDKVFIVNVTSVLDWYAAEKPEEKEINGKKALEKLVNYEVTNMLNNYTQSFNNVENKAIYTIQLPSFASKLLSKLTNKNGNKFNQAYNELLKEDSYKHSNLLNELKKDLKFRQEGFKLSYLDGLKDERGNSEGAKFTNMSPKDFLYMQLALFDNNAETKKEQITENLAKYIYLTPADKTMSMIFDAKKYAVYMEADKVKISPIVNAFYNVVLQEASRVQQALKLKNSDIEGDKLLENYHYLKSSPPTKNADGTWNINWNGQAFRFNYFKHVNKALYDKIEEALNNNLTEDVEKVLQPFKGEIVNSLLEDLNEEVDLTVAEAKFKQVDATKQKLADFALNTWLFNIEASKLLNGDPAIYKDLAKRTYQSGSMTVSSNTISHPKVRTRVVKDLKLDLSEQHGEDYNDVNVTDAQVYWTPEFYKKWHEMRGTWNDDMQLAYDMAEGNIKPTPEQLKAARGKLVGVKPFYFGNRFDENLGIHRYEQVKTAVLPLFKSYIKDNPLLTEKRKEMEDSGLDMIAHESAFKAAIGYRTLIDSNDFVTLELDMDNFGTQVDNPNHILDEENSSLRQLKMLLLGNIDPNKEYNGTSGEQLQFEINQLEGINITEDLDKLKKLINHPTDSTFRTFIVDQLTRRGATENLQQVLEIVNGEFKYPPDLGPSSTPFENLISSIFTDKVVKQSFLGASAVQATALGLQFKNLGQQQEAIDKSAVLTKMQTSLKWVRPGEGDKVEYAEAYMPAWAEEYFDKNGYPKDNIPDELREILIYRIPTEGYHSMLPVKVVGFMPPELGNFIMLPYEITTQFGADFDFDKVYFIAPEFYKDNAGNLFKVEYDESISAEDNTRKARNNRILDNYMKVLSSKETYPLLIKKSGFDLLTKLKEAIEGTSKKKVNFYSSRTQRDLKLRNHVGLGLKGQSALHVSGHSFATMLGLNTKQISLDGKVINDNIFRFNNHETFDLNKLYNTNGELIADELSSMMAAILDDIKDPILEPLGINQFTIDVWSTIVRAGFGTETAINLIASPVIKELSTKLEENTYKIKGLDFEWNSVNSLLSQYDTLLNAVLTKLSNEDRQEIQSELDKKDAKNLDDKSMKFWRDWHGKNEDKLHVTSDPEHNKMLAKYYIYQFRVLNNFGRYDSIAKDLVKINRFFGINKEVGPNIEDIIEKKYLFREVSNPGFTIKGMENMANVDSLNAQYNVQLAALDFFKKYFPYDTPEYKRLKNSIAQKQYGKDLLSISAENRQAINGFIRTYLDANFNYFHDVNNSKTKQRLFVDLPKKIGFIQNPKNDKKYFDGKLRENPFIKQLTVRNEKGLGYISLKGNRLDLHIKDNLIEAFEQLWRNPDTKDLMVDLIKHSFAATGFYSGLNSFHSYIPISVWEEIGYDAYRKNRTAILQEEFILGRDQKENLIDQLIRNFPKKFTKVFEESMFTEQDGLLWTSSELIMQAKKERDMILGDRFVDYLRVYNKAAKKSLLYRQTEIPGAYKLVSSLGKSGRMIEINVDAEIKTSIIADNNTALKEDKPNKEGTPINNKGEEIEYTPYEDVTDVDTNEPIAQPVLESGQLALPSPEGLDEWLEKNPPKSINNYQQDLFGNVSIQNKPIKNHSMSYKMPANENTTGKETSTLELAEKGLRTATTRSFPLGKINDIITFEGRPQKYIITSVEQLTDKNVKDENWIKEWSNKEKWTVAHFKRVLGGKTVHIGSYQTSFKKFEENDPFGNVLPPSQEDIENLPPDIESC